MIDLSRLRCVALTPGAGSEADVTRWIDLALALGATSIWLRERERETPAVRRIAAHARRATTRAGALLWIAGDWRLAAKIGADVVHLGFRDLPPAQVRQLAPKELAIGFSAHDPLLRSALDASDYVTLSPFAAKEGATDSSETLGARRFAELRATIAIPVVALGGIDETNAGAAIRSGADGVAIRRAVPRLDRVLAAIENSRGD